MLVVLLLPCCTVYAQNKSEAHTSTSNTYSAQVTLTIKPTICVASRGERTCASTMDIDWTSSLPGDFCLYSNATKTQEVALTKPGQPLQCWSDRDSGYHRDRVILDKHLDYWISDAKSQQRMTKVTVKIALLKPHRKYPRRRSRLPWSLTTP